MSDPETQEMTTTQNGAVPARPSIEGVEDALLRGDLSKLTPQQRLDYYERVCQSVGLNPLTKPFEYIRLNGQLTLYAKRDAAEQLRDKKGISITKLEEAWRDSIYVVRAYAEDDTGRTDVSTGAVDTSRASGKDLANLLMKAETKAKRRVTLSLAGLGWLDETEVQDIPNEATEAVVVDHETGEIEGESTPDKVESWGYMVTEKVAAAIQKRDERLGDLEGADLGAGIEHVRGEIQDWPETPRNAAADMLAHHEQRLEEDESEEGDDEPQDAGDEPNLDREIPSDFPAGPKLEDHGCATLADVQELIDRDVDLTKIDGIGETYAKQITDRMASIKSGKLDPNDSDQLPF